VLHSQTLDDTLRKVKEAGGRIVKEPFTFPAAAASTSPTRTATSSPSGQDLKAKSQPRRLSTL